MAAGVGLVRTGSAVGSASRAGRGGGGRATGFTGVAAGADRNGSAVAAGDADRKGSGDWAMQGVIMTNSPIKPSRAEAIIMCSAATTSAQRAVAMRIV
jgi:Mrp family chromosome partitioning ATPase